MNEEKVDTNQKALQINMDARKYGTFAEIGAGPQLLVFDDLAQGVFHDEPGRLVLHE